MRFHRKLCLLAGSSAILMSGGAAKAADSTADQQTSVAEGAKAPDSSQLGEIVVTAERRAENLQKTPISVTAYTSEALAKRNSTMLSDIGIATPNMQFDQNGGESFVFIRGIGQSDSVVTSEPGVAIYLDGVYVPRLFGDSTDLLDVERVEVLRGPQGTLFGKNAIGGAISVITKTPSLTQMTGDVDVRAGSRSRLDVGGYVSMPIVDDKLGLSLALSSRNQDGYIDIPATGQKGGNSDHQTARAKLYWLATPTLKITLAGEYYHQREVGLAPQLVNVNPNGALAGIWNTFVGYPSGSPFGVSGLPPKYTSYGTGPFYENIDVRGVSLTAAWDIGSGTLKSISSYRYVNRADDADIDGQPQPITSNPLNETSNSTSQELQYSGAGLDGRLHYVGGLYYLNEHAADAQTSYLDAGLYQALINAGLPGLAAATDSTSFSSRNQITNSYAVYGNVDYSFTDALTLVLGARYSGEDKFGRLYVFYPNSNTVGVNQTFGQSYSAFTPKFGLNYQITPSDMLYVSAENGFKSGGINGRPTIAASVQPFQQETVWNYEVGLKSQWFDNRLRVNLAAFHMDYRDIQLEVFSMYNGAPYITLQNPGNAEMNGFEGEVTVKPTSQLTLGGNLGYNDAQYTHLAANAPVTTSDRLMYTPKWSSDIYGQIDLPLNGNSDGLSMRADYGFRSKYYLDAVNTETIAQPAYAVVNGQISIRPFSNPLSLYVYGVNLTNTYYKTFGVSESGGPGWDAAGYAPPRELGVGAKYKF